MKVAMVLTLCKNSFHFNILLFTFKLALLLKPRSWVQKSKEYFTLNEASKVNLNTEKDYRKVRIRVSFDHRWLASTVWQRWSKTRIKACQRGSKITMMYYSVRTERAYTAREGLDRKKFYSCTEKRPAWWLSKKKNKKKTTMVSFHKLLCNVTAISIWLLVPTACVEAYCKRVYYNVVHGEILFNLALFLPYRRRYWYWYFLYFAFCVCLFVLLVCFGNIWTITAVL